MHKFIRYIPSLVSLLLMAGGLAADYFELPFFRDMFRLGWYSLAYMIVGAPVIKRAVEELFKLDFANEYFLMSVATLGAFAIGEYAEAVAVMLFYEVGELLQQDAVGRARRNIKALLDLRPKSATVSRGGAWESVAPLDVKVDETIMVRSGEKFPLDVKLLSESASVNQSAITGESRPRRVYTGEEIPAGSVNIENVVEAEVVRSYNDSSIARILKLVEEANLRKAPTERFMRKFARYYTPAVMAMALCITFLPIFVVEEYLFRQWVYRAFVFLVIACPCALYVSIPLGYFGGIGAASKNGILFKGADFLDRFRDIRTILIDKTGTLTKGTFAVTSVHAEGIGTESLIGMVAALESRSNHPVAKAVVDYAGNRGAVFSVGEVREIPAMGIRGWVDGNEVMAGNIKLMDAGGISVPPETLDIPWTVLYVALNGRFCGYIVLADELKDDSRLAVRKLNKLGVQEVIILSGDTDAITKVVARELGIDHAHGGLLPEEKAAIVARYAQTGNGTTAFAGDGINDAPSIAVADVGIAMGAMGSDLAIETADVVIQTDQPSKIAQAVLIARDTSRIVWQNIWMVFIVKGLFLTLGALGSAGMWEAVFADMGVALAAIFNAIRIQYKKFM